MLSGLAIRGRDKAGFVGGAKWVESAGGVPHASGQVRAKHPFAGKITSGEFYGHKV